jgi:hypothetical protein
LFKTGWNGLPVLWHEPGQCQVKFDEYRLKVARNPAYCEMEDQIRALSRQTVYRDHCKAVQAQMDADAALQGPSSGTSDWSDSTQADTSQASDEEDEFQEFTSGDQSPRDLTDADERNVESTDSGSTQSSDSDGDQAPHGSSEEEDALNQVVSRFEWLDLGVTIEDGIRMPYQDMQALPVQDGAIPMFEAAMEDTDHLINFPLLALEMQIGVPKIAESMVCLEVDKKMCGEYEVQNVERQSSLYNSATCTAHEQSIDGYVSAVISYNVAATETNGMANSENCQSV